MSRTSFRVVARSSAFVAAVIVPSLATFGTGSAQQATWQDMPRMELEGQFAGPLRDTIIQRLRDPNDGTVCYIYLPITAPHTVPTEGGFVQYGPNIIGSISCVPGTAVRQRGERLSEPSPQQQQ
jgi:hypothetical protein